MKRIHVIVLVLAVVLAATLINVLFGGYLAARLATLPLMREWNLISPRAPIVINNRESVRVSDANDAVEVVNGIKSKLSTLVYIEEDRIVQAGNLLNWTSDGYFITTAKAFSTPGKTYAVLTYNGEIFPITKTYADTASSLVMVQTDIRGSSTIDTMEDKDIRPAQKLLVIASSIGNNQISSVETYARSVSVDAAGTEFSSDRFIRGVGISASSPLIPGSAVAALTGRVVGIWDGERVIASDVIRVFANSFFDNNKAINRAGFGFTYRHITTPESRALKISPGAQVTQVAPGSPASSAGLIAGDVIISFNNRELADTVLLEAILETIQPGARVPVSAWRSGTIQELFIVPAPLK